MLTPGNRIGPYEVLSALGAGGMGEVYRAHDTNLRRHVAIKILPEAMGASPSRLVRFEREARALAALNHPNIATVFGIEEAVIAGRPVRAIVMEFVDGIDLSQRLRRGAMPVDDALPIARQVADALAAAHEAGIVHRDLKPGNIKIREDGTVKVLDFGLAKSGPQPGEVEDTPDASSTSGSGASLEGLPATLTLAPDVTRDGAVVGTAAYMAPEQAKGKSVDKRVDIWAFGVVLFEMLAGRRPFAAGDAADTMARVLATEPDWSLLPAATPAAIRRLLRRCLAKDRRERLHDIADARLEIEEARGDDAARASHRFAMPTVGVAVIGLLVLLGGAALGAWVWRPREASPLVTHARLSLAPAELTSGGIHPRIVLAPGGARTALAWLPDGRRLAFIGIESGVRKVLIRDLATDRVQPVPGTDGARVLAVSPNGREVVFWATDTLQRVGIEGGPVVSICEARDVNGITWGPQHIVFSQGNLFMVDANQPKGFQPVTPSHQFVRQSSPQLLPGEAAVLYTEYQKQWTSGDERVMVLPLVPGAAPRLLLAQAADARYLASGHLVFLRQGTLFVVPFDLATLQIRGEPVALVQDVAQSMIAWDSHDLTMNGQYAVSPQGTLAYVAATATEFAGSELVAVDRAGRIAPLGAPVRGYRSPARLSPDGTKVAVSIQTATSLNVFFYDIVRGGLSRIAESLRGELTVEAWSHSDRIAVQILDRGRTSTALLHPDASSQAESSNAPAEFWGSSFSPDEHLVGMKGGDLWIYSTRDPHEPARSLPTTEADETQPMWSPDGQWLAYTSAVTGRPEVYVRLASGAGNALMVSSAGGSSPAWNPRGHELFYIESGGPRDFMMVAALPRPGVPAKAARLFEMPAGLFPGTPILTPYAVTPDGQRFIGLRQAERQPAPVRDVTVIFNWFEELKAKLSAVR